MKPIDKKDMPKLIALIGLTVCSLGYGIYQLVGGTSVAAPPPSKEKKEEPATASGAPQGAAAPADDLLAAELRHIESVSEPVLVRDPFVVLGQPAATPAPGATPALPGGAPPVMPPITTSSAAPTLEARRDLAQARASGRAATLRRLLGLEVSLPKPEGGGLLGGVPGKLPGTSSPPVVLLPPQPPTIVVTGIIIPESGGGESTAIVRINEHSRWLSAGDSVGNGFVVRSIRRTDRGSELEIVDSNDKKRTFTYRVN